MYQDLNKQNTQQNMTTVAQSISLHDLDDATVDLILELQLTDLQGFELTRKDKQQEGNSNDAGIATELLEADLNTFRTLLADFRMTRSIAQAVRTDGVIIARTIMEEESGCGSCTSAHQLDGNSVDPETSACRESLDDALLSKLAGLYVSEELGLELAAEHNQRGAQVGPSEVPATSAQGASWGKIHGYHLDHHCEACQEPKKYFEVLPAPCRHEYCRDCLRDLFTASLTDENLFPPRCCRERIPLTSVSIFLTNKLKEELQQKEIEFNTPNRTYCSRPQCSMFVPAENIIDRIACCPSCTTQTCTICKAESHGNRECPSDAALQTTLDLARENGWQRCFLCRRLVELDIGCNHMTCRCGGEFCYVCGAQWKTCVCPQWNEDRLVARANQVVEREVPRLAPDDPVRIERVQEAALILRDRHNCAHGRRCVPPIVCVFWSRWIIQAESSFYLQSMQIALPVGRYQISPPA